MTSLPQDPPLHYKAHLFICTNRRPAGDPFGSCAASGSESLRDYAKARAKELGLRDIRINEASCLGRCTLGPSLVVYPEGIWYHATTSEDIDAILTKHLRDGGRVESLMLQPGQKRL